MRVLNLRTAAFALVAGIGLSGCAYGPYGGLGVGATYGNGYDPYYSSYGYGSPYGYGSSGYGSPYGYGSSYGYGSPYGYGYGSPYWGWNNGFYYPGTGYYVYDSNRRAQRWTDAQRRYWEQRRADYIRRQNSTGETKVTTVTRPEWRDFSNRRSNDRVRVQTVNNNERAYVRTNGQQVRHSARTAEQQERRSARLEAQQERRNGRRKTDED